MSGAMFSSPVGVTWALVSHIISSVAFSFLLRLRGLQSDGVAVDVLGRATRDLLSMLMFIA